MVSGCGTDWKCAVNADLGHHQNHGEGVVGFIVFFFSFSVSGVSDEEDQKPVRLPLKVAVELQPRSNHSWTRVQSLAHNPRLRLASLMHTHELLCILH